MVNNKQVIAWKFLKEQLKHIIDPVLRNSMLAEFRNRAFTEWGYNPDNAKINQKQELNLDDWEKEFVEDIEKTNMYELDVRQEKRKTTEKEACIRMADFIEKGGKFTDLPEDLQNGHIAKLYMDVMFEKIKECEDFLKKDIYKA